MELFWLFLLLISLQPAIQRHLLLYMRQSLMEQIEKERKSRFIAIVHRQETMSFLGFPVYRFLTMEDSEAVLRAIETTPKNTPIDLLLHTPGGLVLAATQIAYAIRKHQGKVTVFIPHYAMSGGTLIALAADEICMSPNAVLGPLDPQLGQYPAPSLIKLRRMKAIDQIDDQTLILADLAEKSLRQIQETIKNLLQGRRYTEEQISEIAKQLTEGHWTHDYPITAEKAKDLGLPVKIGIPEKITKLMSLYRQPIQRAQSVDYLQRNGVV